MEIRVPTDSRHYSPHLNNAQMGFRRVPQITGNDFNGFLFSRVSFNALGLVKYVIVCLFVKEGLVPMSYSIEVDKCPFSHKSTKLLS